MTMLTSAQPKALFLGCQRVNGIQAEKSQNITFCPLFFFEFTSYHIKMY